MTTNFWLALFACFVTVCTNTNLRPECHSLQLKFATSSTEFTKCLGKNTKPVHICVNCFEQYKAINGSFVNITHNKNCSEVLLDSDNAMVTRRLWDAYRNMWDSALCDTCSGLSVDTAETFNNMTDAVHRCFDKTHFRIICQTCNDVYDDLLTYFKDLQEKGYACADLADSMNSTAQSWSVDYKCGHLPLEYLPVLSMTLGVSFIPVLFYIGLWKFAR